MAVLRMSSMGFDSLEQGVTCGGDGPFGDGLVEKGLLGGMHADGAIGEGGGGDADVVDESAVGAGEHRDGHFGDGLGVAGAHLANVVCVTVPVTVERDGVDELVGAEGGLFVGEVEVAVGDGSAA